MLYFDWRALVNTKGGASSVDWECLRHSQEIPPFFLKLIGPWFERRMFICYSACQSAFVEFFSCLLFMFYFTVMVAVITHTVEVFQYIIKIKCLYINVLESIVHINTYQQYCNHVTKNIKLIFMQLTKRIFKIIGLLFINNNNLESSAQQAPSCHMSHFKLNLIWKIFIESFSRDHFHRDFNWENTNIGFKTPWCMFNP